MFIVWCSFTLDSLYIIKPDKIAAAILYNYSLLDFMSCMHNKNKSYMYSIEHE